jgi:pilus assembly protein CpaD
MRTLSLLALTAALAGCYSNGPEADLRGVSAVNVPVVTRADYVFDVSAPDGSLPSSEAARLDAWFRSLGLGYGDVIYVDGADAYAAREGVARVAGQYGMLVNNGAPVTAGAIQPGTVRVVVSRTQATVPGCPNWSRPASPNFENEMMSNFGCSVNSNLAAMIANPEDLVHGREGSGVVNPNTSDRAVQSYWKTEPTGKKGLLDVNTKKGN